MSSFWEKGPEVYAKALSEEFWAAKARLKAEMQECATVIQRQALEEELEALKKEFKRRMRCIDDSLF